MTSPTLTQTLAKARVTHRQIRYRLIPGSCAKAAALARLAGACRFVWNHFLAANQEAMKLHQEGKSDKPSTSFYSLARQFTELRRETSWLQELPFAPVRYVLKYQADAFKRFFEHGGHPRFKARGGGDSVTIPDNIRIRDGKLHIPKLGWYRLRRRGSNPYPDARPVQAVIRRELGKWYVTVCYVVPDIRNGPESPLFNGYSQERTRWVGLDMNVRQVTTSDGEIIRLPVLSRLEARKRRYQRMMARRQRGSNRRARARQLVAKTSRKIANVRADWQHQVSHDLSEQAGTVVVEALNTKAMTRSAKGTDPKDPSLEASRKNVKAKSGLNREILATGWVGLRQKLNYKVARLVTVPAAYTSQTCHQCGHVAAENRKSQASFACVRCGHEANADHNAALNILASGIGAAGRGEALALATLVSRQKVSIAVAGVPPLGVRSA